MIMDSVLFKTEDGIAHVTLNRPSSYNAFNYEMAQRLRQLLEACETDDSVRCICLTGAGKAFCSGQDLAEFPDPAKIDFERVVREYYNPIITLLRRIEKPIVAAVNGVAAGAGANIALACDIVIATAGASFLQAFSKIGLIPDSGGTFFLPRLVGMQQAAGLMMLADKVSASDAAAMGMIYKAVPDEEFQTEVHRITKTLAQMPTVGIGLTKRLLNQSFSHNLEQQLALEKELQVEAGATPDFVEGVQAFLEKRKPVFTGLRKKN
jgi:2-(1,2-epoxy-1,2-dihydrophenyl)acetyl-CoA isomerase